MRLTEKLKVFLDVARLELGMWLIGDRRRRRAGPGVLKEKRPRKVQPPQESA